MPISESISLCPICGNPVPPSKGSRPRKYCSVACKEKSKRATKMQRYHEDNAFREYILAMNAKYCKTEKGRAQVIRASNVWKALNPDKRKVHLLVQSALKSGKLVKIDTCEKCGKPSIDAHHENYSRPLDVVWLCRKCHHAAHGHSVN